MKFVAFHGSPGSPLDFSLLAQELPSGSLLAPARPGYERWFASSPSEQESASDEGSHQIVLSYSWGAVEAIRYANSLKNPPQALVMIAAHLFPKKSALKNAVVGLPLVGQRLIEKAAPKAIEAFLAGSCNPEPVPDSYRKTADQLANPSLLRWAILEKRVSGASVLDGLAKLHSRSVQIAAIHGSKDTTGSFDEQVGPVIKRLPLSFVETLEGAGHALVWTRPKQIAGILKERFL